MLAGDPPSETGGERPQKTHSKFDPFRTSRAAGSGKLEMVLYSVKVVCKW
jgi:hypothetical protein